jgi:IS5 family transposase
LSPGQRSPTVKRELRRRAAVEPVIGRANSDGLLERNRIAGARGDAIAVIVGAGHKIRLLLAWLRVLLRLMLAVLTAEAYASPQSEPPALVRAAFFADDPIREEPSQPFAKIEFSRS